MAIAEELNQQLLAATERGDNAAITRLLAAAGVDAKTRDALLAMFSRATDKAPHEALPQADAALFEAAYTGDDTTIAHLLDAGANVNATAENGLTALMLAAGEGHTETAALLLDKGADVNVAGIGGSTALMRAVQNGHT